MDYFLPVHPTLRQFIYLDWKRLHLGRRKFYYLIILLIHPILPKYCSNIVQNNFFLKFRISSSGNVTDTTGTGHSPPGALGSPSAGDQAIGGASGSSDGSWMGYLSNVVSASATYLPSQVTDTLLQGRAFATVHHNLYGLRNICALAL